MSVSENWVFSETEERRSRTRLTAATTTTTHNKRLQRTFLALGAAAPLTADLSLPPSTDSSDAFLLPPS